MFALMFSLVVACAPGNYGGPPVVTLTDLGNGQFGREEMPQCLECPIATFRNEKASEICESCPELHSTLLVATKKKSDCISMSEPKLLYAFHKIMAKLVSLFISSKVTVSQEPTPKLDWSPARLVLNDTINWIMALLIASPALTTLRMCSAISVSHHLITLSTHY